MPAGVNELVAGNQHEVIVVERVREAPRYQDNGTEYGRRDRAADIEIGDARETHAKLGTRGRKGAVHAFGQLFCQREQA